MVGTASVEDVQDREETLPHADLRGVISPKPISGQCAGWRRLVKVLGATIYAADDRYSSAISTLL